MSILGTCIIEHRWHTGYIRAGGSKSSGIRYKKQGRSQWEMATENERGKRRRYNIRIQLGHFIRAQEDVPYLWTQAMFVYLCAPLLRSTSLVDCTLCSLLVCLPRGVSMIPTSVGCKILFFFAGHGTFNNSYGFFLPWSTKPSLSSLYHATCMVPWYSSCFASVSFQGHSGDPHGP